MPDEPRSPREDLLAEIASLRKRPGGWGDPVPGFAPTRLLAEDDPRIHLLLSQLRMVMTETDGEGSVVYTSPSVEEVLGYRPEELIGKPALHLIHPDDLSRIVEAAHLREERDQSPRTVLRSRHRDGHWVWIESSSWVRFVTPEGELRTLSITRDVTELKAAEDALLESEERYRIVATMGRDAIIETDTEGRVVFASPNIAEVLGFQREELYGFAPYTLIHPDDLERVRAELTRRFESGEALHTGPFRVRHRDGHWVWLESDGLSFERTDGVAHFLSVTRDITQRREQERERRDLEHRMQQAQRLESLGVMAGGIAHDFNNLLTPILGETNLVLLDLPAGSPARERLEKVVRAAQRAAALTHQMLDYAGAESLEQEPVDLSRLVSEMGRLLEGTVSGKAQLCFDLAEGLPSVQGDASRLSQIAMNLIANAAEAVGDGEGRIDVRTRALEIGAGQRDHFGRDLGAGSYVCIEVEDTGSGMDADTRARIFDPFFTTKFTGRGLGLAAVLGIVRRHSGSIEIDSEPGRGTRFRVLLPARSRPDRAEPVAAVPRELAWRSDATVLIVDDDAGVREFAEDALRRAGLSVLTAADGREGVEAFRGHAQAIDLVILDRTMPATSGEDAFDAIRRVRPDARVVLTSGHSEERAAERVSERGLAGFLQKPFSPESLLAAVRSALRERAE